jgi:hypothetical protein
MKDLEDPYYNQVLYVPTRCYNLYDGLSPGMRLHNKTILDKPLSSTLTSLFNKCKTFSGSGLSSIKIIEIAPLYNALLPGSYFHYAPDAAYLKINPMVQLSIREKDIQNKKQSILFRQVVAEKSDIVIDNSTENYSVFNAKYYNTKQKLPSFEFIVGPPNLRKIWKIFN